MANKWYDSATLVHPLVALEVACGTGYWTQVLAPEASSITATDASPEVLEFAKQKSYPPGRVTFQIADAFNLENVPGNFTAALVAFWFSHVQRHERGRFLTALHQRLGPGAKVVMIDNRYVEGSSTPIARSDEGGNTYQLRTLGDGTSHEVLKNFPAPAELQALLTPVSSGLSVREFTYFWGVSYIIDGQL